MRRNSSLSIHDADGLAGGGRFKDKDLLRQQTGNTKRSVVRRSSHR